MSTTSTLNKASTAFFLSGYVFSKMQNVPVPIIAPIMNGISLVFYTIGYAFWFISSHYYPEHTPKRKEWYEFAQFRDQYLYASVIGIIGTTLSLAAIAVPILLLPAAWIFLASNLMWTSAEYNILKNPPPTDKSYSENYQKTFLSYTLTMTSMTAITSVATTLVFLFPPIAIPVLLTTTIISVALTILAGNLWLDFTFGQHKPTPVTNSHSQINDSIGHTATPEVTNPPAPFHGKSLFYPPATSQTQQESFNSQPSHTCPMP